MSVFLFPGQGSQFSGMGIDLFEWDTSNKAGIRSLFDTASAVYGSDIKNLLNSDADTLKRTDVSQLAITVVSLAVVKALAQKGVYPSACAGFSLGEYPALAVSGLVSEKEVLSLVFERGRIMQKTCDAIATSLDSAQGSKNAPGMSAIIGLSSERVDAILSSFNNLDVWGANYNSSLQTVISGTDEALAQAEEAFKAAGARRCIRLKVAGPFHSPLMAEAGREFAEVLAKISFKDPIIPLFSNVTGSLLSSGEEAKQKAVLHISSPVLWTLEQAAIAQFIENSGSVQQDLGSPSLIEVGPGKVLSGLWADSKNLGLCLPWTEVFHF